MNEIQPYTSGDFKKMCSIKAKPLIEESNRSINLLFIERVIIWICLALWSYILIKQSTP